MGAICLGPRVTESGRITAGIHGSTFGGNPLACAAALATLDILEQEALPERAAALGALALERLQALRSPLIREARGKGLLLGIELTRRAQPYLEALLERGVLALTAGPNVIRLLPPLVITTESEDGRRPQGSPPRVHPAPASTMTTEVALLRDMLVIPSYSGQERVLAEYLVERAREMGLYACVDDAGNFVAGTVSLDEVDDDSQPVVLLGHMDTVRGAVPVRMQDGVLYGRGAVDAKGPLAVFLCAVARLVCTRKSGSLERPIVVIGAVEEEAATSRGARAVVERYQPLACIIGEPSGSQSMTIGYKGRLLVEYRVTRPIHHSAGPQKNSSEAAVRFWNRVRDHAAAWNAWHAANSTFAALMPSLRSINSSSDGLEEQTRLVIGYRLPPGYDIAGLRVQLAQWAGEDEAMLTFSGEEAAFSTTRTTPLARAFIAAVRACNREQSVLNGDSATPTWPSRSVVAGTRSVSFKYKTGTSDMNVVGPIWGQNILAYGPGDARLDHTPNEHIHIAEYVQAIDVLEFVLRELVLQGGTTQ